MGKNEITHRGVGFYGDDSLHLERAESEMNLRFMKDKSANNRNSSQKNTWKWFLMGAAQWCSG